MSWTLLATENSSSRSRPQDAPFSDCSVTASIRLEIEGNDGLFLFACSMAAEARKMVGECNEGWKDLLDSYGGSNANAIAQMYCGWTVLWHESWSGADRFNSGLLESRSRVLCSQLNEGMGTILVAVSGHFSE